MEHNSNTSDIIRQAIAEDDLREEIDSGDVNAESNKRKSSKSVKNKRSKVKKQKSESINKVPYVLFGIAAMAAVTFLTYKVSNAFIDSINHDADKAYAYALSKYRSINEAINSEQSSSKPSTSVQVTGYSSEDLVQIEGEWYIIASLTDDDKLEGDSIPITVDTEDSIFVDGVKYLHIISSVPSDNEPSDDIPFYGNEYVVVDIDGNMVYLVAKGDTLSGVSGMVGYSVQELADYNSIKNLDLIYEGQTLRIPASDKAIQYVKDHQNKKSEQEDSISNNSVDSLSNDSVSETDDIPTEEISIDDSTVIGIN